MASQQPVTVMIPLGGIGSRFQKEGYTMPKPFISVLGKPMIMWVLDSLKLGPNDSLVIVYNPGWMSPKFWELARGKYPKLQLVELPGPTRGAAETVQIGLRGLSKKLRSQPVMLVDGDCFYDEDIVSTYRAISATSNGVFYFVDTQPKPMYSYIVFDPASRRISQVKEKVKISDHANTGCYCFSDGNELLSQCTALLDAGSTQLSQDAVGEYYTSGVIAAMIGEGATFTACQIDPGRMHVLGTPTQLQEWCVKQATPRVTARRFCFDLDLTILGSPAVAGDYSTCEPIEENASVVRALHAQGHTVILLTERAMAESQGNVGAAVAQVAATTIASLAKHRIPYDELCFGKPPADYYVDDRAVSSFAELHKELGIYMGGAMASPAPGAAPRPPPPAAATPSATPWTLVLTAALAGAGVGALVALKARP